MLVQRALIHELHVAMCQQVILDKEIWSVSVTGNLFANLYDKENPEEFFEDLLSRPGFRVERIVSTGQASPEGFWYDQEMAEWVVLLSGKAEIQFSDEPESRTMIPGDWINISAHRRHRVNWTDSSQPSIWLAIYYQ
jgi:cupin 2 domain-containing protein